MILDSALLKRLSTCELRVYAGQLDALCAEDLAISNSLKVQPVVVNMTQPRLGCDERLYDICAEMAGSHKTFLELRQRVMNSLVSKARFFGNYNGWNLLTVAFDGIQLGDSKDLLKRRIYGEGLKPLYPIEGFGLKLAEVRFPEELDFS
jgi:hypothetical protein